MALELNTETVTSPPRDAASVILLRDTDAGLEVFLIQRAVQSSVLAGAYVFPGGKVDPADADMDRFDAPAAHLHAALGESRLPVAAATALFTAAVRETFEESGVLLAQAPHLQGLALATEAAVHARAGLSFRDTAEALSLQLQTRDIVPWSRWITPRQPSVMNKRFDTRFFVATVPAEQIAVHDNHEASGSVWLRPRAALEQYWNGAIDMAPPQIMTLAHLSRHTSAASALGEARARGPVLVEPAPHDHEGTRVLCYPGDERHPVQERAMPGPTRLMYINKRFEPVGGFEALFA